MINSFKHKQAGFTLVELVTVIILLGVVGTFSSRFIADNVVLYQSSVNQNERLNDARFVLNRMAKELDSAIAFSVRVDGSCMSFVPFNAAGQYLNSVAREIDPIQLIMDPVSRKLGGDATGTFVDQRISVLTTSAADFYDIPEVADDSIATIQSYIASGSQATLTLDYPLDRDSAASRYFIAESKVRYCLSAGQLRRSQVLLTESFPLLISTSGVLMADNLSTESSMSLTNASQFSNAILELDFRFLLRDGNEIKFEHQVVMSNVP
ncbi:type II secretion system protein [Moritella marina ATCC 15381]|uniref:Type II secretion system protein n=1 Tax=Moritella marina ATCC 15381 TaxID=1202962 RepID=A0A5J6WTK4_MORMI|nr:type II secretion system protein [Moritella marina]QFI39742.1 type II secretion system protein [Moritella marina ATCC 15381]